MNSDYSMLSYIQKMDVLNKELEKIRHEINISKLIYEFQDSDIYEDIFKDNIPMLEDKYNGILFAIENLKKFKC